MGVTRNGKAPLYLIEAGLVRLTAVHPDYESPKEGVSIIQVASPFNQLLQHFPRNEFAALVRKHNAEYRSKGFDCWTQNAGSIVVMDRGYNDYGLFGRWTSQEIAQTA